MGIDAFEHWVYSSQELEHVLSANDYLELLSLNYKKSGARYELFNLLKRLVGSGEFEKWKLVGLLERAKVQDLNLPGILEEFYYLYCDGYDFLNTLGMAFGLYVCVLPQPYRVENWRQLETTELVQLVQSLPMLIIIYEADIVLRWLHDGIIVLTGEQDEINRYGYIDHRTTVERERMTQYKF
jgi:hypothetical protein